MNAAEVGMHVRGSRPDALLRTAGMLSLLAAGIRGLSSFFDHFRVSGRTYQLVPEPGPGFAARLSVNLVWHLVLLILPIIGAIGVLRRAEHRDRWAGLLVANGAVASSLALNQWLAKPYSGSTWLAGQYLMEVAGVISGVAALLVIGAWWSEREPSHEPPRPDIPTQVSLDPPE